MATAVLKALEMLNRISAVLHKVVVIQEYMNVVGLEDAVDCKVTHLNTCKDVQDRIRASPDMSIHSYSM